LGHDGNHAGRHRRPPETPQCSNGPKISATKSAASRLARPFVELRVTRPGPDGKDVEAPRDGETPGELEVRGPWVAASYYNSPDQAHRWTADGWFKTGDVSTIDDEGFIKIVDRAKIS